MTECEMTYLRYSEASTEHLESERRLLAEYLDFGIVRNKAIGSKELRTHLNAHLTLISDEISSREALIKLILSGKHKKGSTND